MLFNVTFSAIFMILKKAGLILIFLLVLPIISAVTINEVESNPAGTDTGNEWLEIYVQNETNLTGWKLVNADDDTLFLNQSINGFLVINFTGQWLDNSDEQVFLLDKENNTISQTPLFDDSSNNDNTWNFCEELGWIFGNSTKGQENICPQPQQEPEPEQQQENEEQDKEEKDSIIRIEDFLEQAQFGEAINIEILIYRGDTSKYAVYAYVENEDNEKLSEETTIHVKSKYTEYELEIPVQIKSNCNNKYKDGEYTLILEGLNENDEKIARIKNIQSENKAVQEATEGMEIAMSLPGTNFERQLKETKYLYTDLGESQFRTFKKNKDILSQNEIKVLHEIAEIKRKKKSEWGM